MRRTVAAITATALAGFASWPMAAAPASRSRGPPPPRGPAPPPPGGRAPPIPRPRQVLRGSIDGSGHAKLVVQLVRTHHERFRNYNLVLRGVPVRCDGHRRIVGFPVRGGEGIWNRYAHDGRF